MVNRSDEEIQTELVSLTLQRRIFHALLENFKNSESLQQLKLNDLLLWLIRSLTWAVHKSSRLNLTRSVTKSVFLTLHHSHQSKIRNKTGLVFTSEAIQLWSQSNLKKEMKNYAQPWISNANQANLRSKRWPNFCMTALKLSLSSKSRVSFSKSWRQSSKILHRWGQETSKIVQIFRLHRVDFCRRWQIRKFTSKISQINIF